ncbi:MAG TPA: hypothetical protein VHV30_06470 [Polyangiaceae bacterium]|nr:hypothetical protein [Polyangiaceae bacterium]
MPKIRDLSLKSIAELGLTPEVEEALRDVIAELANDYRESSVAMAQALSRQASALDRIQNTLAILVTKIAPELNDQIPAAISVALDGEQPDLASAVVVADPIGAGFSLSQDAVAKALGVTQTDFSVLDRAFKLRDDGNCAVVVRKGPQRNTVNYHRRAIERFRELVAGAQPSSLTAEQKSALRRVKRDFAAGER